MIRSLTAAAVLGTALFSAAAAPASANDSTAELGAGGLMMIYNEAVQLRSEDLYISADEVRVRYVFRNVTKQARTFTVAFPLPPIDAMYYGDINLVLPDPEFDNYVGFTVTVDGRSIEPQVYTRALAFGIDRTAELEAAGLPLNPASFNLYEQLAGIAPEVMRRLNSLGLFVLEEWGQYPAWRLETVFHWEQTFPPGQDIVVEHTYAPVVGYGFFGRFAYEGEAAEYYSRYCMDDSFRAAADRMLGPDEFAYVDEKRIQYILTTGANWAGPIADFRVTVDKGATNALVSFCADGVTRTSPTTFEWRATDFYPTSEIDILIIDPLDVN